MKLDVTIDSGSKNATVLTREVHVATYKGEIEAMSYSDSSEAGVPSSLLPIPNHLKQVEHALYIMPYRLLIPQCKFQIENHSLSQIL
jgi:hypothetical protein